VADLRVIVKDAAKRVGLEGPLQRAYELRHPIARRDRLDNERLRQLLAFTLREDSNCIDVGCHRGEVLREMVRLAPRGRHIAYEPVPASHAELVSSFPDVDVRAAAASDADGEAEFVVVPDLPSHSGLRERSLPDGVRTERTRVRTERLDAALPDGYVPHFLKIDVEGAELQVLRGAVETLRRHRPTIWFEHGVGASDRYGTRPSDVYELLAGELGMRIFDADGRGPYSAERFDAVFTEPIWCFVAH
jgi:FkbM family methyltransferase